MADERARAIRNTLTRHEVRLWIYLRALRPQGIHVRRQGPVLGYIVDFACLRAKLGIQLDGDHHGIGEQRRHDASRDAAWARTGLRVIRFWNHEVDTNLDGVIETIRSAAEEGLKAERMGDRRHGSRWP